MRKYSLSLGVAIDTYHEREYERYVGGVIDKEWLTKKITYLRNTWGSFVGLDSPVNEADDATAEEFFRIRSNQVKRKETLRQELTIIRAYLQGLASS